MIQGDGSSSEPYRVSQLDHKSGSLITRLAERIKDESLRMKQHQHQLSEQQKPVKSYDDDSNGRIVNWRIVNHGHQTIIIL